MEYYIMKMYLKAKEERDDIEQGFNRYSKSVRRLLIILLIGVLLSWFFMVLLPLFIPNVLCVIIPMVVMVILLITFKFVEQYDEKKNLEKYADTYEKKLDILKVLLESKYEVKTKDKLEELIGLYQLVIDRKELEEKRRNTIIITMFSIFAGICSITFTNMTVLGITFIVWLAIVTIVLTVIGIVAILIYADNLFDSIKKDYIGMIKDLEELKFKFY